MPKSLPFGKWDSDVQRQKKLLAVPPAARWLYFALAQECRFRRLPGRMSRDEVLQFAGEQGCGRVEVKALLSVHFDNPLWREEAGEIVIHDFDKYVPATSTKYVHAFREKRRQERLAGESLSAPAPSAPSPPTPPTSPLTPTHESQNSGVESIVRDVNDGAEEEGFASRVAAVSEWWHSVRGEYALAAHVQAIAAVEIPAAELVKHLDQVFTEENVSALAYFTSGPGMGRLRELESRARRKSTRPRKSRPRPLGKLVGSYADSADKRASSA